MRKKILILVAASVGGCVIPPQLSVAVPESEYLGTCRCVICVQTDPQTLECTQTVETNTDLLECEESDGQAIEDFVETRFRQVCDRGDRVNSECDLVEVDTTLNPLVRVFNEQTCPVMTASRENLPQSTATIDSGQVTIRSASGTGTTSITGRIAFSGANCVEGSCAFRLEWMHLDGTDFSIGGEGIARPVVVNSTPGVGTFFAGSNVIMIPPGDLEVVASGTSSGRRAARLVSDSIGFGLVSQTARQLLFAQSFTADDITVDVNFLATIDNLSPVATLEDSVIECSSVGGANVSIPATIADSDGEIRTVDWYVDGVYAATGGESLDTFLALGAHVVEVHVVDNDGGVASAAATITVQDTIAPQLTTTGICLWPPNHDLYLIEASDLGIADVCDPTANVLFLSGSSNQPDNDIGDGNTEADLVVNPTTVCARGERLGPQQTGRTYTVSAFVSDASGNSATTNFVISTAHDGRKRCDVRGGVSVDDDDPRCQPSSRLVDPIQSHPVTPKIPADTVEPAIRNGGCQSGRSSTGAGWCLAIWALVLLAMPRTRRGCRHSR